MGNEWLGLAAGIPAGIKAYYDVREAEAKIAARKENKARQRFIDEISVRTNFNVPSDRAFGEDLYDEDLQGLDPYRKPVAGGAGSLKNLIDMYKARDLGVPDWLIGAASMQSPSQRPTASSRPQQSPGLPMESFERPFQSSGTGMGQLGKSYSFLQGPEGTPPSTVRGPEGSQGLNAFQLPISSRQSQLEALELDLEKAKTLKAMNQEETDAFKDWRKDKISDASAVVAKSYRQVLAASVNPTPADEIAMIFSFMKMQDPNSVVRESEYRAAEQAAALTGDVELKIDALAQKWDMKVPTFLLRAASRLDNGNRLQPEQVRNFRKTAGDTYKAQMAQQRAYDKNTKKMLEKRGLDPDKVIMSELFEVNPNNYPMPKDTGRSISIGKKGTPKTKIEGPAKPNWDEQKEKRYQELRKKFGK